MINFISIDNSEKWDKVVDSVGTADIYYKSGYVKAFMIHGDGIPVLCHYNSNDGLEGVCVLMLRDIASDTRLNGKIKPKTVFDAVTPYGYGGFVFNMEPTDKQINFLKNEFMSALQANRIVSVFFRFHPVLKNANNSRNLLNVIDLGKTIAMDLTSPEIIWSNISSKNRNMIRKAEKNGVEIKHGKGEELLLRFKEIYDGTMRDDNALDYYFFKNPFYSSIANDLKNNYELFYAEYEGKMVAASIMLFDNNSMNYHLSGSLREYRNLAPSNLLLYKAALWGCEKGLKTFHLGGGVGSGEDNLYKFKAAFNRNSDYQFSIGKMIVDNDKYNELVDIRRNIGIFDENSSFFPHYRS